MMFPSGLAASKEQKKPIEIKCPFCGETVIYYEDMDFYKCPNCSCEIWPQERDTSPYAGMWEAYRECIYMPINSGGGGRKVRTRKNKVGPRLISGRYLLS